MPVDDHTDENLRQLVRPGSRVALGDGCGTPRSLHAALSRAARAAGGVTLVLGWVPAELPDLDLTAFADVRCLVGGPGVRAALDAGTAHLVPARLSAAPALLAGRLRPDLLVAGLVQDTDGLRLGAESSWMRRLIEETDVPVAAAVSGSAPHSDAGTPWPDDRFAVLSEVDGALGRPIAVPTPPPDAVDLSIARGAAALVPEGARVQVGPGRLGGAILAALEVPVRLDAGLLPEAVVDLDARGLLVDTPVCSYLVGTGRLYDWADGRRLVHPVEVVHDVGRLSASGRPPLIAVNTALEIDVDGQVNVEGTARSASGMIGGHPDFAAAGARSPGGLSVIALPTRHRGRSTLVTRLARPVTTSSHDVQVVVTERGTVDLRGLDRAERRTALCHLWDAQIPDVAAPPLKEVVA